MTQLKYFKSYSSSNDMFRLIFPIDTIIIYYNPTKKPLVSKLIRSSTVGHNYPKAKLEKS